NVAEANDPFRILPEPCKVDLPKYAGRSVASSCTEYRFDPSPVESFLEIFQAFFIRTRQVTMALAHYIFTDRHFQIPPFQLPDGDVQYILFNFSGGCYHGNPVAAPE